MKVITPTGGRPESLALLDRYLQRQTFQDFTWIVLDDCEPCTPVPERCDKYIKAEWTWTGKNTQSQSMLRLLDEVDDKDKLVICEDDDWYGPDYLQKMFDALDEYDVVGEAQALYYNIQNMTYQNMGNTKHASLCSTGVKNTGVQRLRKMAAKKYIDLELWKTGGLLLETRDSVGIKGMPGRMGIGVGHSMNGTPDPTGIYLWSLIGDDAYNYI